MDEITVTLQVDVKNAAKWFHDNLLTVNIDKSCVIPIGTRQRLSNMDHDFEISIDDEKLANVDNIKYLGVTIDKHLTWNTHISNLCKSISPKIELLRKLKYKLPAEQLNIIYQSIIQPHFDYCISVWGQTSKSNITLLQRLQNRAARIITGTYDWTLSATLLVKQLGWMTIFERINYFSVFANNLAPTYLNDKMNRVGLSGFNTRAPTDFNLVLPKPNL